MAGKTLACSPWKINFFGRLWSFRYPQGGGLGDSPGRYSTRSTENSEEPI
jgi:hypothetical protein